MKITGFEIEHYESQTIPYNWRDGLVGGSGGSVRQALLRVKTDADIDGVVWLRNLAISKDLVERCIAGNFLGCDPLMREHIWSQMWELDRLEELPMYALGYLDVAVWDIAAKSAGVPMFKLLGGHKSRAKAYASTVTMDSIDDYLRLADRCLEKGYRAIKLHVWGRVHEDIALVRKLRQHVGTEIELMLDGSAGLHPGRIGPARPGDGGMRLPVAGRADARIQSVRLRAALRHAGHRDTGRRVHGRLPLQRRRMAAARRLRSAPHELVLQGRIYGRSESCPPGGVLSDPGRRAWLRPGGPASGLRFAELAVLRIARPRGSPA